MARYHALASEWLIKDKKIQESLVVEAAASKDKRGKDTTMTDASSQTNNPSRKLDEATTSSSGDESPSSSSASDVDTTQTTAKRSSALKRSSSISTSQMDIDPTTSLKPTHSSTSIRKPITLIPNHALHACNAYAHLIPISATESYNACDHWQWTATLWRGTTGPDLTIYIADVGVGGVLPTGGGGTSVEIETVEGRGDLGVFVVRRVKGEEGSGEVEGEGEGEVGVEASVLRRLGFEVSEWVRAFGAGGGKVGRG